jgi:hypothetical protein
MNALTHGRGTAEPGASPDRRVTADRRTAQSILCQEALARSVAKTWGQDSYAGRALKEFERRRAATTEVATGDEEIIIYSLRGQWLVGTVHEIREAMLIAASTACHRRASKPAASTELTPQPNRPEPGLSTGSW